MLFTIYLDLHKCQLTSGGPAHPVAVHVKEPPPPPAEGAERHKLIVYFRGLSPAPGGTLEICAYGPDGESKCVMALLGDER